MLDFKEELSRYEKVLEMDDIEDVVKEGVEKDFIEILQDISMQISAKDKKKE